MGNDKCQYCKCGLENKEIKLQLGEFSNYL